MYCIYCGKELTQKEETIYHCPHCNKTLDIELTTIDGEPTIIFEDITEDYQTK